VNTWVDSLSTGGSATELLLNSPQAWQRNWLFMVPILTVFGLTLQNMDDVKVICFFWYVCTPI
jgi:flagellar assembly factor FliW